MKPLKHMVSMAALDFTPSLLDGDLVLLLLLQASALFLQGDVGQHRQCPQTSDCSGAHELIVIASQFFFAVAKDGGATTITKMKCT